MTQKMDRADTAKRSLPHRHRPWPKPPCQKTESGYPRRVGLELEFAGLSVADTVRVLEYEFDATAEFRSRHNAVAEIPGIGSAEIALDTRHAIHVAGDSALTGQMRDLFGDAASLVVPTEITAPPIEIENAEVYDALTVALREAGALGTRAAPTHAFAMQLNVEAQTVTPGAILDTLRSFLLFEDWLRSEIAVDRTRSILGFEARFPVAYQRMVLDPAYERSSDGFIDDYLVANPTRNRSLDLLPILAELDADRVEAALPAEKVKARPAYHYRLPDCRIDAPDWVPRIEWERWLPVERLKADPARLETAMLQRRSLLEGLMPTVFSNRSLTEASMSLGQSV